MTSSSAEPDTAATPELGLSPEEPLLEGRPPSGPSLSPSRAADFMTCPLLYRFRVIDRIPEAPSAAATRGTVVHSVLERLFDLPAAQRTLGQAGCQSCAFQVFHYEVFDPILLPDIVQRANARVIQVGYGARFPCEATCVVARTR